MKGSTKSQPQNNVPELIHALGVMPDAKRWFVALSGGADSTALLHMLASFAKDYGTTLTALIVNHNLRDEAGAEAQWVAQQCRTHGISAEILHVTQKPPMAMRQEWARAKRYDLLCAYARLHGGVLWLGHHRDDQAETIAMRLSHQSAIGGLRGMRALSYRQGVPILRPLLASSKQDLISYCKASHLAFIDDPSNANQAFERVRWRRLLERDNKLRDNLCALGTNADILEAQLWRALAPFITHHVMIEDDGFAISCEKEAFTALAPMAQMVLLRHMLFVIGEGGYPAAQSATSRLIDDIKAGRAATLAGCQLRFHKDRFFLLPEAGRAHPPIIVKANTDYLYRDRFVIRTPFDISISPMSEAHIDALGVQNPYFQALRGMRAEIRLHFPCLHTLDAEPITPHIKDMILLGHFGQMDWPDAQVEIIPLDKIATGYLAKG